MSHTQVFRLPAASSGREEKVSAFALQEILADVCQGLEPLVDQGHLRNILLTTLPDSFTSAQFWQALLLAARTQIELEPAYTFVAARALLLKLYQEIQPSWQPARLMEASRLYQEYFPLYFQRGVEAGLLDPHLLDFNLAQLAQAIRPERDLLFAYPGLQILYDRYFLQEGEQRIELPQLFWMRVAMGVALNEADKEASALTFYECISQFLFTPATPTLFNAGTCHPQLSSCYVTTVEDDLRQIFKSIQDNALLSKWAGGLGNDWTSIRALGSPIRGTHGRSQGVIPFLKIVNDTAVAVNQGGKRKGAVCVYLENWHLDIEDFLDLCRNTGDERRRAHDLHTACWISDEFMRRVQQEETWTLFSPNDVPDLHELYGQAFARRYREYEQQAEQGLITHFRRMPAVDLWRKMLTRLFETGHPWITWKDPANVRSPQDHMGVIHSSNLCTEILLNTSPEETAVCNLGSLNLPKHLVNGRIDEELLQSTVRTAIRMLDNVIDINYYPTPEARTANMRHRPVGLGVMGFQDALHQLGLSYASEAAVAFADHSMEAIAYYALLASTELAQERGPYPSYAGSKWQRGLLPLDSIDLLEAERGARVEMDRTCTRDWEPVRAAINRHGMRNSNVLAIAPTATISTIIGVSPSIEPEYAHLYVKSNLSGEFTVINRFLIDDLKAAGLWDRDMLEALKYYDGSLQELAQIPDHLKERYLTAFEIDPAWLIECASRRQKWLDMGQSLNLYLAEASGKKLHELYQLAWRKGLKTTYYLRTRAATQIEKSTVDINRFSIQPRWMKQQSPSHSVRVTREQPPASSSTGFCTLAEDCEACQ